MRIYIYYKWLNDYKWCQDKHMNNLIGVRIYITKKAQTKQKIVS